MAHPDTDGEQQKELERLKKEMERVKNEYAEFRTDRWSYSHTYTEPSHSYTDVWRTEPAFFVDSKDLEAEFEAVTQYKRGDSLSYLRAPPPHSAD